MANISYQLEVIANPDALGPAPIPVGITGLPVATPGVAVADATDEATAVTQLNALLASLRDANFIES